MKRFLIGRRAFLAASGAVAGTGFRNACAANPHAEVQISATQNEAGVMCHPDAHPSDLMNGFPPAKEKRVTLENWTDTADTVRWTNNNPARIFKSVPIENARAPVWVLPRRMLNPEKLNQAKVLWGETQNEAREITVKEWLKQSETDGFIVLHDGRIIAEQYFGRTTSNTLRDLYSATKAVLVSVMASFLYGGTFDEHAPVTAYVPEFVGTGWAGATIRQLLDQTTGVSINFQPSAWVKQQPPNVQAEWAWGSPAMRQADNELARQFRAAGRFPKLPHEPCDSGFFDYLRTVRQDHPHGSFFNYSAGNAGVLQVILERTTRASYFEHLTDFWRALGAERCATLMIDGAGCAAGQSGMACTLRDWARWGWMLCDGGRVGGGRTLPGIRELVADTQQHPESEKWTEKTGLKEGYPPGMGYRNHMFAFPSQSGRDPILSAQGAYHQNCVIDPLRKNVVVQVASFWKRGPGVNGEIALQSFMEETLPDLLKQGS